MAVSTWLDITTQDAQEYETTVSYRIKPAALGATTLPSAAKINAVLTAFYGDDKVSDQIVVHYAVRVQEDAPAVTGGSGNVDASQVMRLRSGGDGDSAEQLDRIPGLLKANVSFDPQNPNGISTTGALFDAIRAALVDADIAFAPDEGTYTAYTEDQIARLANAFDGKRAPKRPR